MTVKYAIAKIDGPLGKMGTPFHPGCIWPEYGHRTGWFRRHFSFGDIDPADLAGQHCGYCNDDWQPGPKRLPPFPGAISRHCLNCPPKPNTLPMDAVVSVGFGMADVSCDGETVLDGEQAYQQGKPDVTVADAEVLAVADPDHDWRVRKHGPMGGQEWQRHGVGEWVYVKRIPGFA